MLLAIPTLNEENGLRKVLEKAKRLGIRTVVVDGGSTDGTIVVAHDAGTEILHAPSGKGRAFKHLLAELGRIAPDETHILLIDGDGTYDLDEYRRLADIAHCDMAIGKRVPTRGSMPALRRLGNALLSLSFSALYMRWTPDVLSGFRLISIARLREVALECDGFELETELTARFAKMGYSVGWAPVSYGGRSGHSKLNALADGMRIMRCMVRLRL
jgi:glycosyltransferase involved in cell wall biosynthesis